MNMSDPKRTVLFVVAIGSFLTPFTLASVTIALPSIGKEFALDAVVLSWIPTSYRLAAAMVLLPFGRLADIYGRKRIFTYGILTFTGSALLAASSTSTLMLIISLILQGIGASMIFGTNVAILTSAFPAGARGKVLGINVASVYSALSLGPFLGGFLTQQFGWRSIFLVTVPLGGIIIALIFWNVKDEWAEAEGEKFDSVGSVIYGLTLVTIMYGVSRLPALWGAWIILGGVVGLMAFVMWEIMVQSPVLDITLFRTSKMFSFSSLTALITYSATAAVSFLLSLYLQFVHGLSPQIAGLILIAQPMVQASFSPVAGRLSDRIEPQRVVSLGMALLVVGLSLLTRLNDETSWKFIIVCLIFLGLGFALFTSPNTSAIMSSVEKKVYGMASGTVGTMRLLGQMLSMGIATLLIALYMGRVQITLEYHSLFLKSMHAAFVIFAILCFGGIFVSLARGKVR